MQRDYAIFTVFLYCVTLQSACSSSSRFEETWRAIWSCGVSFFFSADLNPPQCIWITVCVCVLCVYMCSIHENHYDFSPLGNPSLWTPWLLWPRLYHREYIPCTLISTWWRFTNMWDIFMYSQFLFVHHQLSVLWLELNYLS